jgi:tetrapyrrole methylase family protein / MazG family protein
VADPTGGRPLVEVVGLGPGGPDLVTTGAVEVLGSVPPEARFLRTTRHPAAVVVGESSSFDHRYESGASLDEVYASIVEDVVGAARRIGRVVYAVPGSPVVAERTVELLLDDPRVEVEVHPALSFLDLTWARLGVDPVATGVRVVDGHRFAVEAAGERGPLLVAQCDSRFVLSDVKLAVEDPQGDVVTVLQRLGLPDEVVTDVAWEDLDRAVDPDHLTSLWIPRLAAPVAVEVRRFAELMTTLRAEDPWKAAQTHDSLKRYLLEESYEVLEAVDAYDPDSGEGAEELCGELGDLLYQVVFHAAIGEEAGWFTLADVARSIHDKLVARHPHLGSADTPGVDALVTAWEHAKRDEHGRASAFDGMPVALPALARALKVGRKAEALGLVPDEAPDLAALVAALDPADPEALGDVLVAVAEVARRHDVDPEDAARRAVGRAEAQLRASEQPTPP